MIFKDKVAIVTAAGQGMGAAIAKDLVEKGARVVLMSRSEEATSLAEKLGGTGLQGSTANIQDLRDLVELTAERYGRIDFLVNNTGHPPKGDLLDISDRDWQEGFELVLLNVIRMVRLATPHLAKQGGAIVNISTFSAFEPSALFPVSSTFRAALGSFMKLYADRYAEKNIRINNILPGFIDSYKISEEIKERIPLKRAGKVEEIAKTVSFLLSEDAGYITGQNIRVDGGITRSI
ncbi:SDR family oxidoreductase [Fulvivirgaceae bacterium BMA10]|uniref:SDR family oxidoreductase n=1 Tax=Splendidivirga corallicola TaxID=3051826 RepID=A0ABT8KWF9_9BACT|nr:SDR family oxidoreductase [Fulvivirgaceae bacterium BMA10]